MAQTTNVTAGIPAGPHISDNLALKVFSGEVLKTFNKETVMKSRVRTRTLTSGTTAQFPAIGKAAAEYHTPGNLILGQNIANGEVTLQIDDLLISSVFMSNWEEAVNHFETRSEYTFQMGQALAQAYDQQLFAAATKAAKDGTSGAVAGMGSATVDKIGANPTTDTVVDAIYNAAEYFDSTNIPKNDRVFIVTPEVYWDMVQDGRFLNRDFGNGNGNQASGRGLMQVADFSIVMSNNLALNFGTDTLSGEFNGAEHTKYDVDGSKSLGLAFQKQALGTVQLMDVSTEQKWMMERQGDLVISRMSVGHGVLRPECLRLISAEASS
ncbi:phage capsid protein [Shimia sp.]|uniref:phage capsid protein n=1 Tax=Shimia sp. TaxID=1954381 RepID=UPI003BACA62E